MSNYHVLWADDDWNLADDNVRKRVIVDTMRHMDRELKNHGVDIGWVCTANAAEAAEEARRPERDFALVIMDFDFGGSAFDWRNVLRSAQSRGIPFMLFSNFIVDAQLDGNFPKDSPLFIDMQAKSDSGPAVLAQRVLDFFRAPPFRILHLTDMHFDSMATGDVAETQRHLHEALVRTLKRESVARPVDAVVITGDFTGHRPERDLAVVRSHVKAIVNATLGDSRIERLFLVPGNHDIQWEDFAARKIAVNPWASYLDFYQSMYSSRPDVLRRVSAWDPATSLFKLDARKDDLVWSARLPDVHVNLIGLVSPTDTGEDQGMGHLSDAQLRYVREHWDGELAFGEVRIALVHHNLFGVLSLDLRDDKTTTIKAGAALLTLMQSDCSLVLSGHTHTPNLISCTAAHCRNDRLVTTGTVTASSAGTLGGFHPANDRRRAFNVLEFSQANVKTGRRSLSVRTFCYDGVERVWRDSESPYIEATVQV